MATADIQSAPSPSLPDYVLDPNAVLKDKVSSWRYGRAPDYANTRRAYEATKSVHHAAGSLPDLVNNLVKNWEIEASFKTKISDWRTIDHSKYTFAMNGGPPQTAEHMLKVGTYNAIIAPNEYYSPENSDFASSHKTFKRMMPTFAWEVLEVYSGPPRVAFKWRHWGTMKNDYVGFNDKGEKVTAKAHGGPINIQGVTVATVDDSLRVQALETWFDPLDMFRQIAPNGIVNKVIKEPVPSKGLSHEGNGLHITTRPPTTHPKIEEGLPKPTESSLNSLVADSGSLNGDLTSITSSLTVNNDPSNEIPVRKPALEDGDVAVVAHDITPDEHYITQPATDNDITSLIDDGGPSKEGFKDGAAALVVSKEELKDIVTVIATSPEEKLVAGKIAVEERGNVGIAVSGTSIEEKPVEKTAIDEPCNVVVAALSPPTEIKLTIESTEADEMRNAVIAESDTFMEEMVAIENASGDVPGNAVVAAPQSIETVLSHEEMSRISPLECPFLMNRE